MEDEERRCPDDGRCWHECGPRHEGCFRVAFCAPLSDSYGGGDWPAEVRDAEAKVGQS